MSDLLPADLQLHEESKADVEVLVPERRQYGIVQQGGKQIIYTSRELAGGRFAIKVHPDHVNRVLRAIEGSKLAKGSAAEFRPEQLPVQTRAGVVALDPDAEITGPAPEPSVKVKRRR